MTGGGSGSGAVYRALRHAPAELVEAADAALAGARDVPLWLDSPLRPAPRPGPQSLPAGEVADLVVVGGGFTGLWAAVLAAESQPGASVVLLEAETLGRAGSGRNGGFCSASLTHGLPNGLARWPEELPLLQRLGEQNLDEIGQTITRYGIDCDFTRAGEVALAVEPWQLAELHELHASAAALGEDLELLDAAGARAVAGSPLYLGGLRDPRGTAVLDPARLVWGLAEVAERLGVRIVEGARVTGLRRAGSGGSRGPVRVELVGGSSVSGKRVMLATNAFPSPLRRARPFVVPVWDHVLATEPLTPRQQEALGWPGFDGLSDAGNRFHYYRRTHDHRIVWGGYDALYYFGSDLGVQRERNPETERALAVHFLQTFPQLTGVRFSHRWAGAIDTSTRFTAFWLPAMGGSVVAVGGYTGLGVGASRFGARVALDLLAGERTERTELAMVRRPPIPFPPEPLRWAGIQLTRRSIAAADEHSGRRNLWLRTLDTLGLGFDS